MIIRYLAIFLIIFNAAEIRCDENVYVVNGKRALHQVSDKFLSITIDPIVLTEGLNLSEKSLLLAKHLGPAYVRIAGPSTCFVEFSESSARKNEAIVVSPSMWFGLNQWLSSANLIPVFGINDADTINGTWNPKSSLPLLELTDKLNVTCLWQLGYDCSNKTNVQYKEDIVTFRKVLDSFTERKDKWKLVGSDFSRCLPKDVARKTISDVNDILDAVMWEPNLLNELTFPERDMSSRLLFFTAKTVPIWTTVPKNKQPGTFSSAILWMKQTNEAAKMGYDVVFKQPRIREIFQDTPVFWASLLHKNLMGRTVLDVKNSEPNRDTFVYAHCTKNQNSFIRSGALTILIVNNGTKTFNGLIKLGLGVGFTKSIEVQTYILTGSNKGILLNGDQLSLESLEKLPFKPKLRRAKVSKNLSLTVPPKSISFFVIPTAQIPVCMQEEDEISTILQEINEDQNLPISSEISLDFTPRSSFVGANQENGAITLDKLRREIEEEIISDYPREHSYARETTSKSPKSNSKKNLKVTNNQIKATDLDLSSIEMKKILINRAISKAAARRIRFTSEEINELLTNNHQKINLKYNLLSRRANLEQPTTPKVDLDLTHAEIRKVLENRVKSRAASSNVKFTSQELEELTNKASEKLLQKERTKRSSEVGRSERSPEAFNGMRFDPYVGQIRETNRQPLNQPTHRNGRNHHHGVIPQPTHANTRNHGQMFPTSNGGNNNRHANQQLPFRNNGRNHQVVIPTRNHDQPVSNNRNNQHSVIPQSSFGNGRNRAPGTQPNTSNIRNHPHNGVNFQQQSRGNSRSNHHGIIVQPGYRKKRDLLKPGLKLFQNSLDHQEPFVVPLKREINMDLLKKKTGGLAAPIKKKEFKSNFENREEKAATLRDPNQTSSELLQSSEEEEAVTVKEKIKPLPEGEIYAELAPSEDAEEESGEDYASPELIKPKKTTKTGLNYFNLHKPPASGKFGLGLGDEKPFKSKPSAAKSRKKSKNHSEPPESSERLRFLTADDGFDSLLEDDYDFPFVHEYVHQPKQNLRMHDTKIEKFRELGEIRQARPKTGSNLKSRFLPHSVEDDLDDLAEGDYGDLEFDMRPIRFRRNIDMNSITKDDVKTYRKLMYENLKFMQRQAMLNEKRKYEEERRKKTGGKFENHVLKKLKHSESSEENFSDNNVLGLGRNFVPTEAQTKHLEFLKSRVLHKRKNNENKEDRFKLKPKKFGKERELKKKMENRFKDKSVEEVSELSVSTKDHLVEKRSISRSTEHELNKNKLYKMYEPLVIPKEWKPSDIFMLNKNLTYLKNDINLLPNGLRNKRSLNNGIPKDESFMDAAKTFESRDEKLKISNENFKDISGYKRVANSLIRDENIEKIPKKQEGFNVFEKIISKILKILPLEEIPILKKFAKESNSTRYKRSSDFDVSSKENEIESDLNEIEKEVPLLQPELDLEHGDYQLILPGGDAKIGYVGGGNPTAEYSEENVTIVTTTENVTVATIYFDVNNNGTISDSFLSVETIKSTFHTIFDKVSSWFEDFGGQVKKLLQF